MHNATVYPVQRLNELYKNEILSQIFPKSTPKFTAITNFPLILTVGNAKCNPHVFADDNETSLNSTSIFWVKPYGGIVHVQTSKEVPHLA